MCGDRLLDPPHLPQGVPEVVPRLSLTDPVPDLPIDVPGPPVGGDRLLEPPHLPQRKPEACPRPRGELAVAGLPGGADGGIGNRDPVADQPGPAQEGGQVEDEPDGGLRMAAGGLSDRGQEAGAFGHDPRHRLGGGIETGRNRGGLGGQRGEPPLGQFCGAPVVAQHPGERGGALVVGEVFCGVEADQMSAIK